MRRAFTVIELLIVIGIIVLAMALAVPALNLITGTKSTEAATNQINSLLARARNDAIGLQEIRGVMFYYDQAEDRVNVALVEEVDPPSTGPILADVYLDLVPKADHLTMPKGVGLQTIDDAGAVATPNDRYIGYNNVAYQVSVGAITTEYGGVILFDSRGQLVSKVYALETHRVNLALNKDLPTSMGVLLYDVDPSIVVTSPKDKDVIPTDPASTLVMRSQLGFVLYDMEMFNNQSGYNRRDLQITGGSYIGSNEQAEENWLDANAVPLLINRYNGSLIKGE